MSERPKVGVGVFVVRDGKILVGQRQGSHGAGMWALPGGHLEMNESIEDCTEREVLEETGMTITNIQHVDFTNDVYKDQSLHYVTLLVRADWVSGEAEIKEPEKCLGWKWITWPDVPSPRFIPLQNFIDQGGTPFTS
jgi:8-oxo-dGTP diphosphatase